MQANPPSLDLENAKQIAEHLQKCPIGILKWTDEMIADWARILFDGKKSFHMRYNHDITVDGDTAKVSSKSHSFNVYNTGTGGDMWEVWGIYHHTLRREKDGWKVSGLNYEFVHARGNEKAHEFIPED